MEGFAGYSARLEGLLKEGLQLTVDGLEQEKVKSLLDQILAAGGH